MTLKYCKNDKKRPSKLLYNQDSVVHSKIIANMKPSLMTSYHKSKSNGHLLENSLIDTHGKKITERPKSGSRVCQSSFIVDIDSPNFNPLTPGVHKMVIHTYTNLQLKGCRFVEVCMTF